ncbi:CRISPR-associated endonuclease Csy4 [Modicisalibacter ilicicola DSM 19980]|uniref:CRISPR-associated endonuclease Csy4 n=1 Tax=Modicisalibacter ilicicola DSM 19980 TaxID=1121942 RepID=A0A1M5ELC2_9GAMM|nr:type I-F CRISPR-associated endoribonuclease Cas6/Csy4 [Halomonas ilicicola]SHF79976.1 CRISPR-associated endonuclease Csy4 [Halomonas ilicicola DSM 19980]
MDHYIDIRLRPDPEFSRVMLLRALYNKLHRALFDLDAHDIGVSFPEYRLGVQARTLGELLRLHGNRQRLEQLMESDWLTGMRDHVTLSNVQAVPEGAAHVEVKRRQFNTGSESRAKRYAKRHGVSLEEARRLYATPASRRIELPFVKINSRSSQQRFCLFIDHGKPQKEPVQGAFNHYGLSHDATVPWF